MDPIKYNRQQYYKNNCFIDEESIYRLFSDSGFYVFGTGNDARLLTKRIKEVMIKGFFDNLYPTGGELNGYRVLPIKECLSDVVRGRIIICTRKYENDIGRQLEGMGLSAGADFYIWDGDNSVVIDEDTRRYIDWCEENWGHREERKNRILIPYVDSHQISSALYGSIGNYLCDKHDASIDAYTDNWDTRVVSEPIHKIYMAMGVKDIILWRDAFSDADESLAHKITNEEWKKIHNFEDWIKISLFGIPFGTYIIGSFLRIEYPCLDPKDSRLKEHLFKCISYILFWKRRFSEYDYKAVITVDAGNWDGFIKNLACHYGIPAYAYFTGGGMRLSMDSPWKGQYYINLKKFWQLLSEDERQFGIAWAEKRLRNCVLQKENCYSSVDSHMGKIKVVIFPHSLEDDSYMYGPHLFWNNYIAWLIHLGELSNITQKYEWYIKPHTYLNSKRDKALVDLIVEKYPRIKKLEPNVSLQKLKEQGFNWALTVQGTIGVELPYIGIQVINAGYNPHMAFDFCYNPKTIEEYDSLLLNLHRLKKKDGFEALCYYAMNHLFFDRDERFARWSFQKESLYEIDGLKESCEDLQRKSTWRYKIFLCEKYDRKEANRKAEEIIHKLDKANDDTFYKRNITDFELSKA